MTAVPEIRRDENEIARLYVEDEPFLVLGGEVHNSSASDPKYMEQHVWPNLRGMNVNTVLLPVCWEMIEPKEDEYNFSLVEELIKQARQEKMYLVFLWFGLWKNGESFYAPEWVKRDCKRFFRARYHNGAESETISPLCEEAVKRDKAAFGKLMEYLKEHDRQHSVLMVQVENEIGFLKSDRDYSIIANEDFGKEIPDTLQRAYHKSGNWADAFGDDAAEYFMAWHYARAVEEIARNGKEIYPLPMYVNAWLEQHPDRAGVYPSGGPVAKLIPLWQMAAPSLDMISPDIYVPDFKSECIAYTQHGNALFIPETGSNLKSASRVFYAVGAHHAIGFAPFGIEDIQNENVQNMKNDQLAELNIMAEAFDSRNTAPYLKESYRLLLGMKEKLFSVQKEKMTGYMQGNPYEQGCILEFESFDLQLDYLCGETGSAGLLISESDGFYLTGCNTRFTVLPKKGKADSRVEILRYEEGEFEKGIWKRKRILNGDERYDLALYDNPKTVYLKIAIVSDDGMCNQ
ncbi:DUF5597 domain-containing protein [Lachnospiraceae bacterium 54-11]